MKKAVLFAMFCLAAAAELNCGIMIFPKYVLLEKENKTAKVHLVNSDDVNLLRYRIGLKNLKQNHDGGFTEEKLNKDVLEHMIKYSPRKVSLGPKGQQTIKVMARHFDAMPEGDSVIYLTIAGMPDVQPAKAVESNGETFNISLTAIHEIALPVVVRKGSVNDKGIISSIKKASDFDKDPALVIRLERAENKELKNGVVRGDISVWHENKMLGFIKNKYILPDNDYVDTLIKLENAKSLLGTKDAKKAELKVLFTAPYESGEADVKNILYEKVFSI